MSFSLTVGQVSGIIAAGVFVLQSLLPNALVVLLISVLGERHTLVTWSVVQRNLLISLWPTILRTDSVASESVSSLIRALTWARPFGLALIAVAAIVTPLGLYQDVVADRSPQLVPMRYLADRGPFGYGTPARSDLGFSRSCGEFTALQCPGTTTEIHYDVINQTGPVTYINGTEIVHDDYDMRIPKVLADLYQSGLSSQPASVSSFFDIQTRMYAITKVNEKAYHLADSFRYLQSVMLNDKIEPIDGLVVDTMNGGVGFRNHTIPVIDGVGAEWYEDLLWIEPETICVNTNVSLEIKRNNGSETSTTIQNIALVDDGGFANIDPHYPQCNLHDSQHDAQLWCRAHKAAWMTNFYSMVYMNVTSRGPQAFKYLTSHVGARFPLDSGQTSGGQLGQIVRTNLFSGLTSLAAFVNHTSPNMTPGANYSNPSHLSFEDYDIVSLICSGAGGLDSANITNINVECGLVFGMPMRTDGSTSVVLEPDTEYRQPVYSCASANKASIKRVHFRYNSTDVTGNVPGLSILNIRPKQYNNTQSMPFWGVETVDFDLNSLSQLWGLISEDKVGSQNLSVLQQGHLYLPGFMGLVSGAVEGFDYIPGNTAPSGILASLYNTGDSYFPDYSGLTNLATNKRWQTLSANETTTSLLLNLIWTDVAANHMLGTRGWNTGARLPPNLQKRESSSTVSSPDLVSVTLYRIRTQYHWLYAIPAVLALILVGPISITAVFVMFSRKGAPGRIRHYAQHLSSGRLLGTLQHPEISSHQASTREWISVLGKREGELRKPLAPPLGAGSPCQQDSSEDMTATTTVTGTSKKYMRVETNDTQDDDIEEGIH